MLDEAPLCSFNDVRVLEEVVQIRNTWILLGDLNAMVLADLCEVFFKEYANNSPGSPSKLLFLELTGSLHFRVKQIGLN